MRQKKATFLVACVLAGSILTACGGSTAPVAATAAQAAGNQVVLAEETVAATGQAAGSEVVAAGETVAVTRQAASTVAAAVTAPEAGATAAGAAEASASAAGAAAGHTWDESTAVQIALNGSSITVDGDGATVDGSKVTITAAGAYLLSGTLADGQVIVDTEDAEDVLLILDGVDISSSTSAPIYVANAKDTIIVLAEDSENTITDGDAYVLDAAAGDEPNAALFSKSDLVIEGSGALKIDANYNDGIASKDDLTITGGVLTVSAPDDGLRGKDSVVITGGSITVEAQGDGLKADNEEDTTRGLIRIEGGVVNVASGGDAITAQTDVTISAGEFILSTGGSDASINQDASAKAIKGVNSVTITGGTFAIDSADDAIHSNKSVTVQAGTFVIATGDDAIHADAAIEINGGVFDVTKCYEGIESALITINDGDIHIVSSDDGLNIAGGNDGSGMGQRPGRPGRPGQETFAASSNQVITINGGRIVVDAGGDGMDINGSVVMTGGVVIIDGPTRNDNGALDYDVSFKITGGYLVATGSAGMAQAPDESSTQYSVLLNINSVVPAGTLFSIQNAAGEEVLTFAPSKNYQSIAFSSADLANGETYDVYFKGSSSAAVTDGLYQAGGYTGGEKSGSFTISGITTMLGGRSR